MKKIFCFVKSKSTEYYNVIALCEDGHQLANHSSTTEGWAKHDIGINSNWQHNIYKAHCPDGYELIWIDNPGEHEGIKAAKDRVIE